MAALAPFLAQASNELSTSTAGSCFGPSIHVGRYNLGVVTFGWYNLGVAAFGFLTLPHVCDRILYNLFRQWGWFTILVTELFTARIDLGGAVLPAVVVVPTSCLVPVAAGCGMRYSCLLAAGQGCRLQLHRRLLGWPRRLRGVCTTRKPFGRPNTPPVAGRLLRYC